MAPHDDGPTCSFAGNSPFSDDGEINSYHNNCSHCRTSDSSSSSSSYSYSISDTNSDAIKRIVYASAKGFSIGAGLKGGLSIFSLLARLSRRRSSKSLKKVSDVSSSEEILSVIIETLRYGLFLGTFTGTFTSVDEIVAALWGHRRCSGWKQYDSQQGLNLE